MAGHIEASYKSRGMLEEEAERRAWATVNKETGGGKRSGSGRGRPVVEEQPSRLGGERGGAAGAARPAGDRSASAKQAAARRTPEERAASARRAAATRKRNAAGKNA